VFAFLGVIASVGLFDMYLTRWLVSLSFEPWSAKVTATALGLVLNFAGRRFIVFPEPGRPDWKPQNPGGGGNKG
jgi:putative flippase GtrA